MDLDFRWEAGVAGAAVVDPWVLVLAVLATGLSVSLFPSLMRFKADTVSWLL
jgi:hypothetical protein